MNKTKPMPVRFYRYGYEYVRIPKSTLQGAGVEMVIDPNIQFGQPTIKGTRLPLQSLASYGDTDEAIAHTANMFDIPEKAVREAVGYVKSMPIFTAETFVV